MKIQLIVDITDGLVNSVHATAPVEVLFVDYNDTGNPRARIAANSDGPERLIWASNEEAQIDPAFVREFVEGIEWIEQNPDS